MASNSDALGTTASEYREARASVEKPEGGVWPVGGARNPLADQVAAGADAQEVADRVAAGDSPAEIAEDGPVDDTTGEVDSAATESAKTGVSAANRRAATASTKSGPAKS